MLTVAVGPASSKPGNGGSGNAAISADGRFVAIASAASNLIRGDTNGVYDVFVRDRLRGVTTRASVGPRGVQANARTGLAGISRNGRFVAIWSDASNLVGGDTNGVADVFVRDRVAGTTARMSIGLAGQQLDTESGQAAISADGRFVAFSSGGSVFVRDRASASAELIGRGAMPALSAEGRFVALNNGNGQVVVRDRATIPAKPGDAIFASDTLRTSADGAVGITLRDDTRVSLGANSEVRVDRYVYSPGEGGLGMVLKFMRGVAVYVSGRIAKLAPDSVRLETPSGIVGVRGTTVAIRVEQ